MPRPRQTPEQKRAKAAARQARHRALVKAEEKAVTTGSVDGRKIDLVERLADRFDGVIENMTDDELMDKDTAPALNVAVKVAALKDRRAGRGAIENAVNNAWALIQITTGVSMTRALLPDPDVIEGEAFEIDESDDLADLA